jgi:hypothetical protein
MPAPAEIADVEFELDSRPTPNQRSRCRAARATWPSRSGLEAWDPDCGSPMVVTLVRGSRRRVACGAGGRCTRGTVVAAPGGSISLNIWWRQQGSAPSRTKKTIRSNRLDEFNLSAPGCPAAFRRVRHSLVRGQPEDKEVGDARHAAPPSQSRAVLTLRNC